MSVYALIPPFRDDADYLALSPGKYDPTGGDPAAWQPWVTLTAPGQWLTAAAAGFVSTVGTFELPPAGIPVKIPRESDGKLAAADDAGLLSTIPASVPETTTLLSFAKTGSTPRFATVTSRQPANGVGLPPRVLPVSLTILDDHRDRLEVWQATSLNWHSPVLGVHHARRGRVRRRGVHIDGVGRRPLEPRSLHRP